MEQALRNLLQAKLMERGKLSFTYTYYDDRGGELILTAGDHIAREMLQYDFDGIPFENILGPGSCHQSVMMIYTSLYQRKPCETFLNLYCADGTPVTSYVSFRVVPYSSEQAFALAGNKSFGTVSVAKASVVGSARYCSTFFHPVDSAED